jgi:hypothetical protein
MKSMAVDLYKQQSKMLHEWITNNHEKENRSGMLYICTDMYVYEIDYGMNN